jgi:hypothetical protein
MQNKRRLIFRIVLLIVVVVLIIGVYKYIDQKYHLWFPSYVKWAFSSAPDKDQIEKPQHIMFLIVDHFEPGSNYDRLFLWLSEYEKTVSRHRDADGRYPQRVFSFPIEQYDALELEKITQLCVKGYGEIEMQLHHFDDTEETLRAKYELGIRQLQEFGWFITQDSVTAFSFVHGNWALDDSRYVDGRAFCGVPNEIKILSELGCYLDVTFPSITVTSQPSKINSIYYSTDDPLKPKSYNTGVDVEVGKPPSGDLMHLEGPLLINWSDWRFKYHPTIEDGAFYADYPPSPKRIKLWLKANVHVIGQPNWIFVKTHAHGARLADSSAVRGSDLDKTLTYLEGEYNDGENYILHYVTTREAYNIIKAAEAGETGNPNTYRDYILKPYMAALPGREEINIDSILNSF